MARGLVHPFSQALYEQDESDTIRVTDGDRWGRFNRDGSWIEGELRECDPQMCNWVGGPQVENHRVGEAGE